MVWRLDGINSSSKPNEGVKFCFQYHASCLQQYNDVEVISLYDNSAHGSEAGGDSELHMAPTSSGKILELNTTSWTSERVQDYYPPDSLLSKSQGPTQVLANCNVLVNWGCEGTVTEFLPNGSAILHPYMHSGNLGVGVQNHRAFRYNWTGLPNEAPGTVILADEHGTSVYVSGNGDTETKFWRILKHAQNAADRTFAIGEVERTSVETVLSIPGKNSHRVFSAVAVDAAGNVIRSTQTARTQRDVYKQLAEAGLLNMCSGVHQPIVEP